ncbi:MAG: hypothetical protein ACREVB_11370, partial [Burkholderiales bacterium]
IERCATPVANVSGELRLKRDDSIAGTGAEPTSHGAAAVSSSSTVRKNSRKRNWQNITIVLDMTPAVRT